MATWTKFGKLANTLLKNNGPILCVNRTYLEYDLILQRIKPIALRKKMPGPYPTTDEERRAAAEKYGMHPYEYVPLPPDETGAGDYPDLPWKGVEAQDPYYPWDFPAIRKNFGEPLHCEFDIMGEDRYAAGVRERINYNYCAVGFWVFFISCYGLHLLFWDCQTGMMEKQIPGKGVHYTFESAS